MPVLVMPPSSGSDRPGASAPSLQSESAPGGTPHNRCPPPEVPHLTGVRPRRYPFRSRGDHAWSIARTMAATRSRTPGFTKMLPTCVVTVASPTCRAAAISELVRSRAGGGSRRRGVGGGVCPRLELSLGVRLAPGGVARRSPCSSPDQCAGDGSISPCSIDRRARAPAPERSRHICAGSSGPTGHLCGHDRTHSQLRPAPNWPSRAVK
jgi:hypothetical protein